MSNHLKHGVAIVAINLLVLVILAFCVEGASWLTLRALAHRSVEQKVAYSDDMPLDTEADSHITDPAIIEDYLNEVAGGYSFRSYIMYTNRPFTSRHVNNDTSGVRSNGAAVEKPHATRDFTIWTFGSSSLYGARGNSDSETMPANLERILNANHPTFRVHVINFGVRGYSSAQDLLAFNFNLTKRSEPDMVVVYNGFNDFANIFVDQIYKSSIVHAPLEHYWDMHERRGVVNWPMLVLRLADQFPNCREVIERGTRYLKSKSTGHDLTEAKRTYLEKADQIRAEVLDRMDEGEKFYASNVGAILAIAAGKKIPVILVQQPILWATTKRLSSVERQHMMGFLTNWTALSPAELEAAAQHSTSWLRQAHLFPRDVFLKGWARQREILQHMAIRYDMGFVDAQAAADKADTPVWNTDVHLTADGNALIAQQIALEVNHIIKRNRR